MVIQELRSMLVAKPEKMSTPKVTDVTIRDGQQSALDFKSIIYNTPKLARYLAKAINTGFASVEIAGGQSFQSAIKNGYNSFTLLHSLDLITRDSQGNRVIDFQMLFRGANALGFKHYSPKVVEATLEEFIDAGVNKIRFFDALNDIDNIYIPDFVKDNDSIIKQGALCFGRYKDQPDRYTNEYYVNYTKALIAKGCNSIAIKDMSGQLDSTRIATLLPALQTVVKEASPNNKIPIELHIHSTNEANSLAAIRKAINLGIDCIDTAEEPLSGGASHHSISSINSDRRESDFIKIDPIKYRSYKAISKGIFAGVKRQDLIIETKYRNMLCAAGVPGGAMPVVMADITKALPRIKAKNPRSFDSNQSEAQDFENALKLFSQELARVCRDAGYPLLVTPTADICTKQAINNMEWRNLDNDNLEARYGNLKAAMQGIDPRFVKLVLGHYGQMKKYQDTSDISFYHPDQKVIEFFNNTVAVNGLMHGPKIQSIYDQQHPYLIMLENRNDNEYNAAYEAAQKLYDKYKGEAPSFASLNQLAIMYALKPHSIAEKDPIEDALKLYSQRVEGAMAPYGAMPFNGFEFIIQPLLDHLEAMIAFGKESVKENPLAVTISEFGSLGDKAYDAYKAVIEKYSTYVMDSEAVKGMTIRDFITNIIKQAKNEPVESSPTTVVRSDVQENEIARFLAKVESTLTTVA